MNKNDYTIRNCKIEDLTSIVSIYNEAIPLGVVAEWEPITIESKSMWFSQHLTGKYPIWILQEGKSIKAWLSFSPFFRETPGFANTVELSLFVSKNARGKGIGKHLVRKAIESKELGFNSFIAHVNSANKASFNLLKKSGFRQWGILPKVYKTYWGELVDLIVFGLNINN